jgi:DOMON domain
MLQFTFSCSTPEGSALLFSDCFHKHCVILCAQFSAINFLGVLAAGGYDYSVAIDDTTTLQYNIVAVDGVQYMQAQQTTKGDGWTGWALSPDPFGKMIGSNAVIGEVGMPVQAYDLVGKQISLSAVPSAVQDLKNTSIAQSGGHLVLRFSRPLISPNGNLSLAEPQMHLTAYTIAANNGVGLGYHDARYKTSLQLDPCKTAVVADAPLPLLPPPTGTAGTGANDVCTSDDPAYQNKVQLAPALQMYWSLVTVDAVQYMRAKLLYAGEGWVGWALSRNGGMVVRVCTL